MEVGAARELRPRPSPPGGITIEPLLATGTQGWLARPGPSGHPDNKAPQMQLSSFLVGAAIEVVPDAEPAADKRPAKGRVIIVSGAFCNNAGIKLFGDLAFNICNWLAERKVLLNIQSNKYQPRQMRLQPQQTERVHTLLVQVVPSLFLVAGIVVFFVRRRL